MSYIFQPPKFKTVSTWARVVLTTGVSCAKDVAGTGAEGLHGSAIISLRKSLLSALNYIP